LYRIEIRYRNFDLYRIVSNFDMVDMHVLNMSSEIVKIILFFTFQKCFNKIKKY